MSPETSSAPLQRGARGHMLEVNGLDLERSLAHRGQLTRPERVEPTSQAPVRHRRNGQGKHEPMARWPIERSNTRVTMTALGVQEPHVNGALLLTTSDSGTYAGIHPSGEFNRPERNTR